MGQAARKIPATTSAPSVAPPAAQTATPAVISEPRIPSLSGGSPLVPSTRSRMESAFGRSFGGVRVHTDGRAASFARDHEAEAVTTGKDIAFGASKYNPGTESGDRLIAHELAHVVQQGSSAPPDAVQTKSEVSTPNEPAELQADAAAARVMAGQAAGVTEGGYAWSTRNRLMRKALAGAGAPAMSVPVPVPDATTDAGGPPRRKRKRPDALGGEAATEKGEEADGTSRERERGEESAGANVEAVDQVTGDEPVAEETRFEKKKSEGPKAASKRAAGGGLTARLAQSLRAREAIERASSAPSPEARDALREAGGSKPEEAGGKAGEDKAPANKNKAEGERAKLPEARAEGATAREIQPEGGQGALGGDEAAGAAPEGLKKGLAGEGKKTALGEKGKGADQGVGEARGAKAEGEAKAKQALPGEAKKGLAGAIEKRPAGAAPGAVGQEPAAAGGGGGPAAAGGGGGGAGGEGGAESPEAQATEEKMAEQQPEEEKAAEAQQDGEQEAAEGGGGGGEVEEDPAAGGGEGGSAEAAGPETASGGGGSAEEASPEAAGDAGGGGPSAAEKQVEARNAPAMAEAEKRAEEERQAEAEVEEAQAQGPEAAGSEDGQLSPAERDAAMASVSEDAGGGGGADAGGGGGGGGGAIADQPAPEAPDVSDSEPKAALGSLKGQAPLAMRGALGGVSQSVSRTVGERKQELAASPPTRAASTGMPGKHGATAVALDGGAGGPKKAEKVPEGAAVQTPTPEPTPEAPPPAVNAVRAPATSGGGAGEMSPDDAARMGAAIASLPTSASDVDTSAGPPPTVALEGNAAPAQVAAQRATMARSVAAAYEQGRTDAQKPLGEDEIAPEATDETLAAKVPGGGGGGAGGAGPGGGGSPDEETASIIAHEKNQGELDAAVDKGQGDMAQEEESEREASEAEKQRTEEEAAKAESEAAEEQEAETTAAKREVATKRGEWSEAQQAAVDKSSADADAEQTEVDTKVETEKTQADEGAEREIASGEEKARKEKRDGEAKAEREKAKAKEESSGFFGWVASKATAFFNALKEGLKSVMKALREAVKAAIDAAKKAAVTLIEKARQAIVAAIRAAGDALIAISDVALAAFPEAKAKFQQEIRAKVQAAEDAVNNIADKLKKGVTALLDALGEFLDKALGLLEKALLAVVDAVAAAVQSAIKAAEAAAKALGMFMVLIKDVAANPGQWIANLGAAVVDGIKNHLLKAMKTAISEWFKSKVEEVLGIPIDLMKALFKGGFNLAMIGQMAWQALKTAVPAILIQLLIEKLVAMVVPAAGAVMVVIEGLQAAWGAVSRIIAAIDKFITFLKAVKGGGAGPAFANAVAAAGVVVIDFVANWLLLRLMKPAKKVSGKLAAIAKKILAKIKKALKKIGKKLKKLWGKIKKKLDKVFGKGKKRGKGKRKDKKKKDEERLQKAVEAIQPSVVSMLQKGTQSFILRAKLAFWKVRYRLTVLNANKAGKMLNIVAQVNPKVNLAKGYEYDWNDLLKLIQELAEEFIKENPQILVDIQQRLNIATGKKGEQTTPFGPKNPDETLQMAHEFQTKRWKDKRRGGDRTTVEWGHVHKGGPVRSIHEVPNRPHSRGDALVRGANPEGSASTYRSYEVLINDLERSGVSDKRAGQAMQELLTSQSAHRALKGNEKALGEMMGLMFGTEVARDKRNLLFSVMHAQMLAENKISLQQMKDMMPASMAKHLQGVRMLNAELAGKNDSQLKKEANQAASAARREAKASGRTVDANQVKEDAKAQARESLQEIKSRQIRSLKRWFRMQTGGKPGFAANDLSALRTFVKERIASFFRSNS